MADVLKMDIKFEMRVIVWDDASSMEHGWVDPADEEPTAQLVKTIGFLVNEDEDYLVIASTTDGTWVNGRFQIPKGMVRSNLPLLPAPKKRVKKVAIDPRQILLPALDDSIHPNRQC